MIEVYDRGRNRIAVIENAFGIREDKKLNGLCYFTFSIPYNDPKAEYCKPYCYVRHDSSELYRIMPSTTAIEEAGSVTYECEHVLATLLDNVLYGYHVIGNVGVYTDEVIRYILARQTTANWVLDTCDFRYQFEYGFENENLLSALFAVFAPFAEPCKLETDTRTYPWKLSIKRLRTTRNPDHFIRYRKNLKRLGENQDPERVCTRIYPLGYGEGVNQLTIKGVNAGVPYLQSPPDIVSKYGIKEKIWINRRYADAETLKAVAAAILRNIQTPEISYEIEYIDDAEPGQRVRIIYPDSKNYIDAYITAVTKTHDDIRQSTVTISNRDVSIASKITELAEKQWISESYAQGATNVYCQSLQSNCDAGTPATLNFYIPEDLKIVNRVFAKVRIKPFRAYSKTTDSRTFEDRRTGYSESYSNLESSTFTDSSNKTGYDKYPDGYTMNKNNNAVLEQKDLYGDETVDSSFFSDKLWPDAFEYGIGNLKIIGPYVLRCRPIKVEWVNGETWESGYNLYQYRITEHVHIFNTTEHAHTFIYPAHNHEFNLPAHSHDITPGIYEFGNPQSFSVLIDGKKKKTFAATASEMDITELLVGTDGKIPRGKWFEFGVLPDGLAYASITLVVQGFVQSRGNANA